VENHTGSWRLFNGLSEGVADWGDPCITKGAKIGGNKGGTFKKPFLKFFKENLL